MLLSLRKNGLASLFKEVRVFKDVETRVPKTLAFKAFSSKRGLFVS